MALYSWDSYFIPYLQVVHGLSFGKAGWVGAVHEGVETLAAFPVVYLSRKLGFYKPILLAGSVLYAVGLITMFFVRKTGQPIGLVIMSQCFVGIAGSAFNSLDAVAMEASRPTENLAVPIGLLLTMFSCLGGALGNALAAAVWNNILPKELRKRLPEETRPMGREIYNDLRV